jgi:membrane-associated phospholipid phosphatase
MPGNFVLWALLFITAAGKTQTVENSFSDSVSTHTIKKQKWAGKVMIASGYAIGTYFCYRYIDSKLQDESQELKSAPFNTFFAGMSDFGLGRTQAIAFVSTSLVAFLSRNQKLKQTVITWGGALVINSIITEQVKMTFQRHRPNTGDPYNVFDWRHGPGVNKSFASAHTSNAFTTATIFATLYKNHVWVPYVAYGLASLVGVSRIYRNEHWASDVMAGAAIGFLSAKTMNGIYKAASKRFLFLPHPGLKGGSVSMVYAFK